MENRDNMAKIGEKFKRCVMSISFQERKKKELTRYKQEIKRLENMDADEMEMEYINTKAKIEYEKNVFMLYISSIIISILMGIWKKFFIFIDRLVQYAFSNQGIVTEQVKVVLAVLGFIVVFISVIIFAMLMSDIKMMAQINKKLMMIEKVRSQGNN